jgi:HEAT repeats
MFYVFSLLLSSLIQHRLFSSPPPSNTSFSPSMRPNRRTLFLALLLLLTSIILWQLLRPRPHEPIYQGKPLHYWLRNAAAWDAETSSPDTIALLSIGTNALPVLIEDLHAHDYPIVARFYMFLARHSLLPHGFTPAIDRRERALKAITILGPLAKPAIPALADCLDYPGDALDAVYVLGGYGSSGKPYLSPEATPALLKALTNNNPGVRATAANRLGLSQTQPDLIVPALIRALKDPAPEVRRNAASAFGGIYKKQPDIIVPRLIETLDDNDAEVRKFTAWMLGRYGPAAKDAIPKLTNLLSNAPPDLEKEIQTALQRIDPAPTNQPAAK